MDTDKAMNAVGQNCGNLVFQYAVTNLVADEKELVGSANGWKTDGLSERFDAMVIPSANFLREGADFTGFVRFLEKSDLPLVFIGLGAQADDFSKEVFDFHPSVLRLIDLIKERSAMTSIRGDFTAQVLDRFGVQDIEITGCPSNFINDTPNFPEMIADKLRHPMRSFITHADEPWPQKKAKSDVERRLVNWTVNGRAMMVQQAVPHVIQYLRQNNRAAVQSKPEEFEKSLAQALMPEMDLDTFRYFISVQLRTYFSVDQWLEDSSKFDFSVGLRLHGNMAAWQAGTPALWISHDSRTRELAETMALPSISMTDFLDSCETVEDAWNRIEFDPDAYRARRAELKSRLDRVLQASGVAPRPLERAS